MNKTTPKLSIGKKRFVFSIDVEDWFQVENLKAKISFSDWDKKELRVVESTKRILEIFRKFEIKATFFVLGWIAEKRPQLVTEIAECGHEIASHGYGHGLLYDMTEEEIRTDIRLSIDLLSTLSKKSIVGYRSPNFSITDAAADILKSFGIRYDASYNQFQFNDRYGKIALYKHSVCNKECGTGETFYKFGNGLIEFPVTINSYMGINYALGGAYFRLSPEWFLNTQLKGAIYQPSAICSVANIYLHPWEFDPCQPRVRGLAATYYFRHYYGLNNTLRKFERFVNLVKSNPEIEITTFREIIDQL